MATPISRDILNRETDARFWAQSGHKPGKRLDPKNPLDKAKMPVWMDIFRKVQREAEAGTLITTYDKPEVAQPLADAEVASTVATIHVDAAAKAPDPVVAQQHTTAATTATQVVSQKLNEAASNQPPTVSPKLVQEAAREAAKTPPPPQAPAADHIAHAQTHNGQFLRPEDDPWDPRFVPKSKSPREAPVAPPPPEPPTREGPPREVLYKETNARFWNRTRHKPGQRLDMKDPQDRKMAKVWMDIFREVQREANEGTLVFTSPELVPAPDAVRPPPPRPTPPPPRPPTPPMEPPMRPPMQQPMGPPIPPMMEPMQPPMRPPMMEPMQPMRPPMMQPPMRPPMMQPPMRPPERPSPPPSVPTMEAPPPSVPTEGPPPITTEVPPEGMSTTAKIALGALGLAGVVTIVYAATRKSSQSPSPRSRSRSPRAAAFAAPRAPAAASSSPLGFPPPRGPRS